MTVDLSLILNPLIQIAGLVLTGVAGWAAIKVGQFAHLSKQSASLQTVLGGVDRAISYGQQIATQTVDANDKVAVKDATTAAALNYVVTKFPGTLAATGIDVTTPAGQQHVADLILAKLPPA